MIGICVNCKAPTDEVDMNSSEGDFICVPCKLTRLGRPPREFTEDECRERFLRRIWDLIDYYLRETRRAEVEQKLEGLAFSILSILDGASIQMPGFAVVPKGCSDDSVYHRVHGEDWWPYNRPEAMGAIKCDLSGSLHDLFYKFRPGGKS
jgi:hypothetical protein